MTDSDNPIVDQKETVPSPAQSVDETLRLSIASQRGSAGGKESVNPQEVASGTAACDRFLFGKFVHDYTWGNILLAEQKAAFVFAAETAFVGYLITKIPANFVHLGMPEKVFIVLTFVLMGLSVSAVAMAVVPRLGGDLRGLIYFKAVASRSVPEEYTRDALRASKSELDAETMQHNYEMAKICVGKFEFVRRAIWLGICGFASGLAWLWMVR